MNPPATGYGMNRRNRASLKCPMARKPAPAAIVPISAAATEVAYRACPSRSMVVVIATSIITEGSGAPATAPRNPLVSATRVPSAK